MTNLVDHEYLGSVSADTLAAMLLELASQLHVERCRRLALEAALTRAAVIDAASMAVDSDASGASQQAADELDQSLRRLLRIATQTGDHRSPLRSRRSAS